MMDNRRLVNILQLRKKASFLWFHNLLHKIAKGEAFRPMILCNCSEEEKMASLPRFGMLLHKIPKRETFRPLKSLNCPLRERSFFFLGFASDFIKLLNKRHFGLRCCVNPQMGKDAPFTWFCKLLHKIALERHLGQHCGVNACD